MKLALFLLSACTAVVVVLASPHSIHVARRHAIAARAPIPVPENSPRLQRRQCRSKPSSSSSVPSSSTAVPPGGDLSLPTTTTSTTTTTTTTPYNYNPGPTTTTTSTPQPTTTSSNDNGNVPSSLAGTHTGQGTWFNVALGACGWTNVDTDHVVAVSHVLFDSYPGYNGVNPNTNPVCGKTITATYQGKSTTVIVADRCAADTCTEFNLDFSEAAFQDLAELGVGRLNGVEWSFD